MALTASLILASATAECTECSVARLDVDRRVRKCFPVYARLTRGLQGLYPINLPSAVVLVALSSDRGLPALAGSAWIDSGLPGRTFLTFRGSLSSSRQLSDYISILPQFFPSPTVVTTWPKGVWFAQGALTRQIHQDIPPVAGVENV